MIDGEYECTMIRSSELEKKCLHVNRFFGRFRLQEQQLCDDQGRDVIVDRSHQTDDSFLKKSTEYVVTSFASATLLDDW